MFHILQYLVPNQSLILLYEDKQTLVSHVYTNLILSSVNSKMRHKPKKSLKISSLQFIARKHLICILIACICILGATQETLILTNQNS